VLRIDLPTGETLQNASSLRWTDIQGRDIQGFIYQNGQSESFNVEALNPGLYTVQIRTERMQRVVRFIKN